MTWNLQLCLSFVQECRNLVFHWDDSRVMKDDVFAYVEPISRESSRRVQIPSILCTHKHPYLQQWHQQQILQFHPSVKEEKVNENMLIANNNEILILISSNGYLIYIHTYNK